MQFVGRCFCPHCQRLLEGVIVVDEHVWLSRRCPDHGEVRTMLYSSPSYFETAALAESSPSKCLVVEVTQRCDVGCATCSAKSDALGTDGTAQDVVREALETASRVGADVIALSGGEPLMRADLWTMIDALGTAGVGKIVLITSGRRFEDDPSILSEISRRREHVEICLQFDSLDDGVLQTLRTPAMNAALRRRRLALAVATGASTTAVCVVPSRASEDSIGMLARFCRDEGAAGITFQPLRQLGRFPIVANPESKLGTIDYIQSLALRGLGLDPTPEPYGQQPFDISAALMTGAHLVTPKSFFQIGPKGPHFRVATSSYWDYSNYFAPLATAGPHYFFTGVGSPLNARYFLDANSLAA